MGQKKTRHDVLLKNISKYLICRMPSVAGYALEVALSKCFDEDPVDLKYNIVNGHIKFDIN
jgi:hypothetical protein